MTTTDQQDLAARLWSLCHVLRDDGIVYHKYLSELTYLLFLKNAKQLGVETDLPDGCRWDDLLNARGPGMLRLYRLMLTRLGEDVADESVRRIFSFPTTVFSHDENLEKVVDGIETIDWHQHGRDGLGEVYESLLERNANEARSGSGQYFTPRPLVNAMVRVTKPKAGETILDPAAGTGGFLIAAHRTANPQDAQERLYEGVEIEGDTFRLALMNLYLHGMNGKVIHGDALTTDAAGLSPADLVLANPPFGSTAGGARPRREDLPYPTGNKQLAFLQSIGLEMASGARAAVVVPDNVMDEPGVGLQVRRMLVKQFDLHTILRLPNGIFYAPGVRTNVLFFNRLSEGQSNNEDVWFYDLRTNMPSFSKRNNLRDTDFDEFVTAYGPDSYGRSPRDPTDRFTRISKEELQARDFNLDVRWIDNSQDQESPDLADLLDQMGDALIQAQAAMSEINAIVVGESSLHADANA
ncbi:N-6 DNA methylase [Frigoribacterium sp. CFBP 13605]|uniref:class I SAM-dependent DNA methyltransferase n=1 Tax=Frigoribacterium sp. CFBP 13605 TaxID=2774034 RepID=UPI0019066F0E|nr:N-6 DNA methylase [Frigoribacterium sp. CFBP 13605]MBD8140201.1 N-6 DNA methylase [Frigoribacterium sp. CFBP 13605]